MENFITGLGDRDSNIKQYFSWFYKDSAFADFKATAFLDRIYEE